MQLAMFQLSPFEKGRGIRLGHGPHLRMVLKDKGASIRILPLWQSNTTRSIIGHWSRRDGTLALHLHRAARGNPGSFSARSLQAPGKTQLDTSAVFLDQSAITRRRPGRIREGKELSSTQQSYFCRRSRPKVYGAEAMFRDARRRLRRHPSPRRHLSRMAYLLPPIWNPTTHSRGRTSFDVHGDLVPHPSDTGRIRLLLRIPLSPSTPEAYPILPWPASHACQSIESDVRKLGVNSLPIPLGLKRNEADPLASKCGSPATL